MHCVQIPLRNLALFGNPYLFVPWLRCVQIGLQNLALCENPNLCVSWLLAVQIGSQNLALQNTLMRPGHVLNHLADVTRGLISAPTEHVDQFFVDGLTNRMFETNTTAMDGLDLVSRKIHGCVAEALCLTVTVVSRDQSLTGCVEIVSSSGLD